MPCNDGKLGWKCYQSLKKSSLTVASNQQILVISCHVNFTIFPTPLSKDMELSYLIVNQKGDVHCSFLIGKSRLAPLKAVTIPRMELSAAVVATRLDKMMRQELNLAIDESTFWTDSTCVLRYIENESRRFQTFVANRVSKIHDASKPSQWRYVSTNLNPADDTSRGLTTTEILENERWLMGPAFLRKSIEHWPSQDLSNSEIQENDPELKKAVTPLVMAANKNDIQNTMCKRFEKFSSWEGLKKAIAWIVRYKRRLREMVRRKDGGFDTPPPPPHPPPVATPLIACIVRYKRRLREMVRRRKDEKRLEPRGQRRNKVNPISIEELDKAERLNLEIVQGSNFQEELNALATPDGEPTKKTERRIHKASAVYKLDPKMVNGLLCVGGRLEHAPIESNAKYPISNTI